MGVRHDQYLAMTSAMRGNSPLWLFDLDNTLHDASHAIFPAIKDNMNAFLAQALAVDGVPATAEAANALRLDYWRRYGATLLGMVRHHQVRPEIFLREAHRFDDLAAMVRAERGLIHLLQRLPGRKILLTNAPLRYSRDVLRQLGLHRHFAQHIAIESMRVHGQLRPKPSPQLLRQLLAREGVCASQCVLVEDTLETLKTAKALGLRTVWVTRYLAAQQSRARLAAGQRPLPCMPCPSYVDVKIKSVRQLSGNLHRLR